MSHSIIFDNHDFALYTRAEVLMRAALTTTVTGAYVPGRAGLLIEATTIEPRPITVRLYLELNRKHSTDELSDIRHTLSDWLKPGAYADLILPDEPNLIWHQVVCQEGTAWDQLFEDGHCDVYFVAYDPIALGTTQTTQSTAILVDGTWYTWPVFELTAQQGNAVSITHTSSNETITIEHSFSGNETIVIDCENELVTINGTDARTDIALTSDFFYLLPGTNSIRVSGASQFTTKFTERWV